MKLVPIQKPQITKPEAEKIAKHFLGADLPGLVLIGVRGYYSKTMGDTPGNDINLYDDAMILVGQNVFGTWNSNTDPSFVNKGLATLLPGVYLFHKGKHHGRYNALRSFPEGVSWPCTRDGKPSKCSAINIHKGGLQNSLKDGVTWSHGCQTIPSTQWDEFIETVYKFMYEKKLTQITYILVEADAVNQILKADS